MIKCVKEMIKKMFGVSDGGIEESYFLSIINFYLLRLIKFSTKIEIERRKELEIFEYRQLSAELPFYPYFTIHENNLYGTAFVLSRAFSLHYYTRIEHGLYLGSIVPERNCSGATKKIITFSDYRKNHINNKSTAQVIFVGPYIQYAQCLMSDEKLESYKKKLGKVLLIFPSHSIESVIASFDIQLFINFIETKKTDFDTVLICLYWKDISLGMAKQYENHGYKVVTAGHSYDYYFLDRLKTIIALSDMTISNKVGTHLGYCIAMNKPHFVFNSSIEYLSGANKEEADKELNLRKDDDLISCLNDLDNIYQDFSFYSEDISFAQRKCVSYYWGESNE